MVEDYTFMYVVESKERKIWEMFLKDKIKSMHDVEWNCLVSSLVWCKGNCIEELEEMVDFLSAL